MPRIEPRIIAKKWGTEVWHQNCEHYCLKTLVLQPGFKCSLHYHPAKVEGFLVLEGRVLLEVHELNEPAQNIVLEVGDTYHLGCMTPHRFQALDNLPAIIIEASTTHSDEDVVRLEESSAV